MASTIHRGPNEFAPTADAAATPTTDAVRGAVGRSLAVGQPEPGSTVIWVNDAVFRTSVYGLEESRDRRSPRAEGSSVWFVD